MSMRERMETFAKSRGFDDNEADDFVCLLADLEKEGFKLIPREATDAMCWNPPKRRATCDFDPDESLRERFRAMWDAAPPLEGLPEAQVTEEMVARVAEAIADAMNMNRVGRLELDAARAALAAMRGEVEGG